MVNKKEIGSRKYGTFNGIFVPTFLTIIGVILFLRLGYIVGSEGILGTILIIVLAVSVSITTGLALSSITTNLHVGSGGAYSIISKTLGLEVGGSVGVPLYLAQIFSIALYVFGFVEVWTFIFPSHSSFLVLILCFLALMLLTLISTRIAMKTQVVVFVLLVISLLSVFLGGGFLSENLGNFSENLGGVGSGFWKNFALFFPAITGLMAGIGMSGELSDPKKQIPRGVVYSLISTTLIYLGMVIYLGISASSAELIENSFKIVELSFYGPLVLAGILAATFSSALATLVAAPRLLQALGENEIVLRSKFFSKKSSNLEPRNATIFSGIIILFVLMLGNLNSVASILTIFFLISYAMVNLAVLVEQSLSLVSFRPTFKVPRIVPFYGLMSSLAFIFFINVLVGFLSIGFMILIYVYLSKKELNQKEGDIRSGLLRGLAEWAARKTHGLPESTKHIWKPKIFVVLNSKKDLSKKYPLIENLLYPKGNLSVLRTRSKGDVEKEVLDELGNLERKGIFASFSQVSAKKISSVLKIALQTLKGQFFHPNILLIKEKDFKEKELSDLIEASEKSKIGIFIYRTELYRERKINVWISEKNLDSSLFANKDFDLAMLSAYKLSINWRGRIVLRMNVRNHKVSDAKKYLKNIIYESRFPKGTKIVVNSGDKKIPSRELNIFSINNFKDLKKLKKQTEGISKIVFVKDSNSEDTLA